MKVNLNDGPFLILFSLAYYGVAAVIVWATVIGSM